MFFANLFDNNFWILVLLFCILGSLPLITTGINLLKTQYRSMSYLLFSLSAVFIILSFFEYIRSNFLAVLVVGLAVIDIIVNRAYKYGLKHKKFEEPQADPDSED